MAQRSPSRRSRGEAASDRHRRITIELGLGFAVAWAAGATFAWWVKSTGGWTAGTRWDTDVLRRIHTPLPRWLDFVMLTVPWFGTNITILAILIPACIWVWRRGRNDLVVALSAVSVGSYLLNLLIKLAFGRPRPTLWERRGEYTWSSYPSGHAIAMMSVLPIVAWLIYRERGWVWPFMICIALVVPMVYSRVYLGVHWPTDVVAGLIVGAIWGIAVRSAFRRSERVARRGQTIE
jgi:undecaprenyl-diphosphatase